MCGCLRNALVSKGTKSLRFDKGMKKITDEGFLTPTVPISNMRNEN